MADAPEPASPKPAVNATTDAAMRTIFFMTGSYPLRHCLIQLDGHTWHGTARLATSAERERIWQKGAELHPGLIKERAGAGNLCS